MSGQQQDYVDAGISHFDIAGNDATLLGQFYRTVFGWHLDEKGPGYTLVETPDGCPNGAIVESEAAGLVLGITVANLEKTLESVQASGGEIVMPITDNGWVKKAQFKDVAGNLLTPVSYTHLTLPTIYSV